MKKLELRQLIKEEIQNTLSESNQSLSREDVTRVKRYLEDEEWMRQIKDRDRTALLNMVNFFDINWDDLSTLSKYSK